MTFLIAETFKCVPYSLSKIYVKNEMFKHETHNILQYEKCHIVNRTNGCDTNQVTFRLSGGGFYKALNFYSSELDVTKGTFKTEVYFFLASSGAIFEVSENIVKNFLRAETPYSFAIKQRRTLNGEMARYGRTLE
jgi:hypothetical protein